MSCLPSLDITTSGAGSDVDRGVPGTSDAMVDLGGTPTLEVDAAVTEQEWVPEVELDDGVGICGVCDQSYEDIASSPSFSVEIIRPFCRSVS